PDQQRQRVQERKAKGLAGNRALKLRTPPWLSRADRKEIRQFYKDCPPGMSVDHIIPIVHPELAGLHVIGNLRYLPLSTNISRANRFECSHKQAEDYVRQGLAVWRRDVDENTGEVDWAKYSRSEERRVGK